MSEAVFAQFTAAVNKCLREAESIYNVDLSNTRIEYNLAGRCAGQAWGKRAGWYRLRFNHEAVLNYNKDMIEDIIPHEVAHLVCFADPNLGVDHDFGWKRVCRKLGGDDSRTHDMTLTPAKVKAKYIYNVAGHIVKVGPAVHKRIQLGVQYTTSNHPSGLPVIIQRYMWQDHIPGVTNTTPRMVASSPKVNVPSTPATGSKREVAEGLYKANRGLARKDMIALFVAKADMTPAGAATYYQNFKSKGI